MCCPSVPPRPGNSSTNSLLLHCSLSNNPSSRELGKGKVPVLEKPQLKGLALRGQICHPQIQICAQNLESSGERHLIDVRIISMRMADGQGE